MTLEEALAENAALKANVEALSFQLEQLKRLIFGARRERLEDPPAEQGVLWGEVPSELPTETEAKTSDTARRPVNRPKRQPLPPALPRVVTVIDLPEESKPCPCCGGERHVIGELVSEKLDYVPAQLQVLQTRRPKYACRACASEVAVAPLPPSPIEQGIAAPGLLAQVVVSKFMDHLPLHRQEGMFRRHAIELPRATLGDWVLACAELLRPLYLRLGEVIRTADILHGDDTPVALRGEAGMIQARAWNYLAPALNLVAYVFTENRAGEHPQTWLAGWRGYLIADAYAGYDRLYGPDAVVEVGCWAHARRKFFEVAKQSKSQGLAHEAVRRIGAFYHRESQWKHLAPEERQALRRKETAPLLEDFKGWAQAHLPKVLPRGPLAKAFAYTLNQWEALTRFLEDGRLPLDNNAAERALRPIAVGRKNWLFAGSFRGGEAAAIHLSLLQSAKLQGLNPYAYLKDILTRMPSAKAADLDELLPHRWRPSE